ncbi:MAG: Txe/YoeB family addiction module toxin [Erysipelotrichaceae bacterium]|nr:Txe/YoeB family addiction module toxin [Erysipelotrichaceae bacterium]
MNVLFTPTGWNEYLIWQTEDRKTLIKINRLIKSIMIDGALKGEGKPEILRYINGYSRRIDEQNRLVYQYTKTDIIILSCEGHYDE